LITGCDQSNPTNSSITIFEKFPDWNYLYCEDPTGEYSAFIRSGAFLVIEPKKNNPQIYAWQYSYELDLTYGGTSKIEERRIKNTRSHEYSNPKRMEPNYKLSSFYHHVSDYCGKDPYRAENCKIFNIKANPTASYNDWDDLYLNRSNLFLDRVAKYAKLNNVRRSDNLCKFVDIKSNELKEIQTKISETYKKAVKYHQYIIDQHNALKEDFKI
jgi:hypothetical protein